MALVADHDFGIEIVAARGAVTYCGLAIGVLDDDPVSPQMRGSGVADGEVSEASRKSGSHLAPANMAGGELLASSPTAGKPETKLRPLLKHGVARAFHCSGERQDLSICIEPDEFSFAGNGEYVGKIKLTKVLPECIAVAGLHVGRAGRGLKTGLGIDQTNYGFVMAYPLMEHGKDADCPRGAFGRAEKQQTPVP